MILNKKVKKARRLYIIQFIKKIKSLLHKNKSFNNMKKIDY